MATGGLSCRFLHRTNQQNSTNNQADLENAAMYISTLKSAVATSGS